MWFIIKWTALLDLPTLEKEEDCVEMLSCEKIPPSFIVSEITVIVIFRLGTSVLLVTGPVPPRLTSVEKTTSNLHIFSLPNSVAPTYLNMQLYMCKRSVEQKYETIIDTQQDHDQDVQEEIRATTMMMMMMMMMMMIIMMIIIIITMIIIAITMIIMITMIMIMIITIMMIW